MSSTLIHCATHKFKNIYEEVNGKTTYVHFNLRVNNFKFMNKKRISQTSISLKCEENVIKCQENEQWRLNSSHKT